MSPRHSEKLAAVATFHYDAAMTDSKRPDGPHCIAHPETALVCPRCIAAKGGRSRSKAKLAASKRNAKLGAAARRGQRKPKLAGQ